MTLLILVIINTSAIEWEDTIIILHDEHGGGVLSKVYVEPPNFEVLADKNRNSLTIIKESKTPENYDGLLIKLNSDDLTLIKNVIINLNIEKIFIFREDSNIGNILIEQGFNIKILN